MNNPTIYQVDFKNATSEEDAVDNIREAVARSGPQVGDCIVTEMNHTEGVAQVEVYGNLADNITYIYDEVEFQVDCIVEDSPFFE